MTEKQAQDAIKKAYAAFAEAREQMGSDFHPLKKKVVRTYFTLESLARKWGVELVEKVRPESKPLPPVKQDKPLRVEPEPAGPVLADNADDDPKAEVKEYSRKKRTRKSRTKKD